MIYRVFLITFILLIPVLPASAQQESSQCKFPIVYGNKNQVDPKLQSVNMVSGRVFNEVGDVGTPTKNPARELGAIPGACLGLFTEKGHRLIASAEADDEGRFKFKSIPHGKYRLVVRDPYDSFCVANMPLRVSKSILRRNSKTILIHMRSEGIDDCSYGEVK